MAVWVLLARVILAATTSETNETGKMISPAGDSGSKDSKVVVRPLGLKFLGFVPSLLYLILFPSSMLAGLEGLNFWLSSTRAASYPT